MARIDIEGTVASTNSTGTGFRVEETWEGREGRTSRRFWSVWYRKNTGGMAPPVGAQVKVTGYLSTKVSERDPRFVDHTINEAHVELLGQTTEPAPPDDPWGPQEPAWDTTPIPSTDGPW